MKLVAYLYVHNDSTPEYPLFYFLSAYTKPSEGYKVFRVSVEFPDLIETVQAVIEEEVKK